MLNVYNFFKPKVTLFSKSGFLPMPHLIKNRSSRTGGSVYRAAP